MTGIRVAIALAIVTLCAACNDSSRRGGGGGGGSADGGGGGCPNVSGAWTIADHCTTAFEGMSVSVTQTGCSFTLSGPFEGFAGTTGGGGSISVTGNIEGEVISCTGTTTAGSIDLSCNGECPVRLVQGGDA